jgi:hypothetical protein
LLYVARERDLGGESETSAIICLDYGANVTSLEVLQNFHTEGKKILESQWPRYAIISNFFLVCRLTIDQDLNNMYVC